MNIQKIDLDISKRDALTQMVTIGQGDASGTTIEATIYDNGALLDLTGKTAMLEVRLPDGKSYVRDGDCTVSGGKITYVVDEEHVGAVAGVTDEAYFDILDGPTVIYSTNRFRLRILRSAHDGAQPAESWDNAVDAMIARGDAAIASAISDFDTRQDQNDAAQAENDLMQAKNNADQAINNQAAQGLIAVLLTSDQYDATTRKPTITGEIGKIYLVPRTDGDENDHYIEWMWLNSAWEGVGTTKTAPEAITTDQIDAVIDGEGGTGNQTLSLTGLNYLWAKEVDYFDDHYTGGITTKATQGPAYGPLVSVTAEGHAEQDGTPTPSDPKEIRVVRGRNLFGAALNKVLSGSTGAGFALVNGGTSFVARVAKNTTYTIRDHSAQAGNRFRVVGFANEPSATQSTDAAEIYSNQYVSPRQYTFNSGMWNWVVLSVDNATYYSDAIAQLELGSTAHPYVPYGYVGLDVTADGTTTTTPIPLPSRGWVGSLPDGTHDALAIDGAGHVTWELGVYGRVLDGTDMSGLSAQGTYAPSGGGFYELTLGGTTGATEGALTDLTAQNSMSNRLVKVNGKGLSGDNHGIVGYWQNNLLLRFRPVETDAAQTMEALQTLLTSNPTSFYLPMQVKPTEDMGYVDPPNIPDGAVVSIPELEGLGVESWTSDAMARYVRAWAARQ